MRTFLGKNKDGGCLQKESIETGEDSMKISPKKKANIQVNFLFLSFLFYYQQIQKNYVEVKFTDNLLPTGLISQT